MRQNRNQNPEQVAYDKIDQKSQAKKEAQEELIIRAVSTFNGKLNDYIDNVRKEHEQIIDKLNEVLAA